MAGTIDRRSFLAGALGVGAAGALEIPLGRLLGSSRPDAWRGAEVTAPAQPAAGDRTLVLCTLYGGNDGLNTVVPYEDPAYLAARENVAVPAPQLLALGDGLGLNPALANLKSLWDAGQVAIVRGVGYPDGSLSHFQSMAIWQAGSPSADVESGWLGRWLDRTGSSPLRACSVGPGVPQALSGERARASAVQDSSWWGAQLPELDPEQLALYRELQRPVPGAGGLQQEIAAAASDMVETSKVFARSIRTEPAPALPKGVQDGDVGTQLGLVSSLIRAGLSTSVYAVSQNGYDTHAGEPAIQSQLLGQLDVAIQAFFASLAGHPRAAGVTLLVYTEFGRRVVSNASSGTDHGTANNVYVVGPAVRGGFYGEQPSLTRLDENGNLLHNVDFRSVYATVLERVLGVDAAPFLGRAWPSLGFL